MFAHNKTICVLKTRQKTNFTIFVKRDHFKLFNFVELFKVQLCPFLYISSICVIDFSILSNVQFCQTWEFKVELRSEMKT